MERAPVHIPEYKSTYFQRGEVSSMCIQTPHAKTGNTHMPFLYSELIFRWFLPTFSTSGTFYPGKSSVVQSGCQLMVFFYIPSQNVVSTLHKDQSSLELQWYQARLNDKITPPNLIILFTKSYLFVLLHLKNLLIWGSLNYVPACFSIILGIKLKVSYM